MDRNPGTSLPDIKAALRREVFARRKAAHADAPTRAARAMATFEAAGLAAGAGVVSAYLPIRTEIDPLPLMAVLHAAGHRVCVPVIEAQAQPLAFREWRPGVALEVGAFDVQIPVEGDWLEPELLIAPLVAFDRGCWRLGYGGGFYDRTLEKLRALRPTRAVGYAYAAQEVPEVPREPTDQPLDAVVTEDGVLRP